MKISIDCFIFLAEVCCSFVAFTLRQLLPDYDIYYIIIYILMDKW